MTILRGRILPLISVFTLSGATVATAQEYFREFGSSRTSGGFRQFSPAAEVFEGNSPDTLAPIDSAFTAFDEEAYNMRFGNLDFVIAAGLGIEFNDNITLEENNRISDFIFRPQLDIEGAWRISEDNRVRFGVSLGYAKYLENSEYDSDSLLVSPTSAITWSVKSGAVMFTFRERLSYQEDPFDLPVLSGVANYARWENQAGIQIDWDATETIRFTAGYDRYDLWANDEYYESQDHGINTIYLRPGVQVSPTVMIGVNTSMSWFDYTQDVQSDGTSLLVGPFVLWNINDFTDIYAEVGYQQTDFDDVTTTTLTDPVTGLPAGVVTDTEDAASVYVKLELRNRPSESFRHKISFSKTTELGYGSNYYDLYHGEYTADWSFGENSSITGTLFYEFYETSGTASEEAARYGIGLGWHRILSEHLTIGLDYRFLKKDSNQPGLDYYQNLGMLSLYYKF